mgnify:CR=1 FL=1
MRHLLSWLWRHWLVVLVVGGFAVLLVLRFDELVAVLATLAAGQWQWIALAALLQVIYFVLYAALYQSGFAVVGVHSRTVELVPVLFASIFFKAIVPSGGVSSLALFVDYAIRRGQSSVRAVEGSLLVLIADLGAIAPLALGGLLYLATQGLLEAYQTVAVAIYLVQVAGLIGLLFAGRWAPHRLCKLLELAQRGLNRLARIARRPGLPVDWASRQAGEFTHAGRSISQNPRGLRRTLGIALFDDLLNMVSLYAIFLAYQQRLSLGALVATFAINMVFSVVTLIPHGIGVAEGTTVLVLTALNVDLEPAIAITVAFRGLDVWLPIFIGFFFARRYGARVQGGRS